MAAATRWVWRATSSHEFARILAMADAFGQMTQPWPPRPAISATDALAELRSASGTHFDPLFVAALADAINR